MGYRGRKEGWWRRNAAGDISTRAKEPIGEGDGQT